MTVFVDTSAIFAIIDADDNFHKFASQTWISLVEQQVRVTTNNYVLLESIALLQRHIGLAAVKTLQNDMVPWLIVEYIEEVQHHDAISLLFTEGRRRISLVDCSAFATMHQKGIQQVFTFDKHFIEKGFDVIPEIW